MQPISGPGAPLPGDRPTIDARTGATRPGTSTGTGEQPLTPAQRTTLERLIVKIMSLSSLKSAELWPGYVMKWGLKTMQVFRHAIFRLRNSFLIPVCRRYKTPTPHVSFCNN